jgi:hypothetical protein
MTVFWVVAQCRLIALMTEAESTSETSVNFYQTTQHNNPEDSHLHTRCHENLKPHILCYAATEIVTAQFADNSIHE